MCPTDSVQEARSFWETFFRTKCHVAWEDVGDIDAAMDTAIATPLSPAGGANNTPIRCRIVVPSGQGQDLSFDVQPASGNPEEQWVPTPAGTRRFLGNAKREVLEGGMLSDVDPCTAFGPSVPRLAEVPSDGVSQLFQQLQEHFPQQCDGADKTTLALAGGSSSGSLQAKKMVSGNRGAPLYVLEIEVATSQGDPVSLQVNAIVHEMTDQEVIEEREKSSAHDADNRHINGSLLQQSARRVSLNNASDGNN